MRTSHKNLPSHFVRGAFNFLPSPFGRGVGGEGCECRNCKPSALTLALSQWDRGLLVLATILALLCNLSARAAADESSAAEQAAFAAAVDRVAPSVVQIETIGGLEKVEGVLLGTGPTTGLIVDPEGYIVSSAFNFIGKPASILVRLPGGALKPAKLVATDHARLLVLLKIEPDQPLPVCPIAPKSEMRVGQWTIAVGRTFESDRPNAAVGILSAVGRVSGRAIQTDAAVSPNNYGGPLLDLDGRVMGILTPLSPRAGGQVAGMEWYDSGIGFAAPAEDLMQVLPRMKKGEDLHPGLAGISLKGPNQYTAEPIVAACRPKCPATAAGIRVDDRITEIDGRPVNRSIEVADALGRRYAGDIVRFTLLRGKDKEKISGEMQLAEKLEPYQFGFLGVLPMRGASDFGVAVRYVYPESPAAKAGIAAGDVLTALDGEPIAGRLELWRAITAREPENEIELEVARDGQSRKIKIALGRLPDGLPPAELPAAVGDSESKPFQGERPAVGVIPLAVPEFNNKLFGYVPDGYRPDVPHGVVVWLHGTSGFEWPELLARWKPLCDKHAMIFLAPKSADPARWTPGELDLVDRLLAQISAAYAVDPARVVVCGHEGGGTLAFLAAFNNREAFRAAAVVEAAPMGRPPENDPLHRLAIYIASAAKSPAARPIEQAAAAMRKMMIPITMKPLGDSPRQLSDDELAELVRWIDMLDRI
jgi:serine protease Do